MRFSATQAVQARDRPRPRFWCHGSLREGRNERGELSLGWTSPDWRKSGARAQKTLRRLRALALNRHPLLPPPSPVSRPPSRHRFNVTCVPLAFRCQLRGAARSSCCRNRELTSVFPLSSLSLPPFLLFPTMADDSQHDQDFVGGSAGASLTFPIQVSRPRSLSPSCCSARSSSAGRSCRSLHAARVLSCSVPPSARVDTSSSRAAPARSSVRALRRLVALSPVSLTPPVWSALMQTCPPPRLESTDTPRSTSSPPTCVRLELPGRLMNGR